MACRSVRVEHRGLASGGVDQRVLPVTVGDDEPVHRDIGRGDLRHLGNNRKQMVCVVWQQCVVACLAHGVKLESTERFVACKAVHGAHGCYSAGLCHLSTGGPGMALQQALPYTALQKATQPTQQGADWQRPYFGQAPGCWRRTVRAWNRPASR